MEKNDIYWNNIFCKEDILYKLDNLQKIDNKITRNVEMIVFQEMYNIIDDEYAYLKNLEDIPFEFSKLEIKYINNRINRVKSPLLKSIYTFFKHMVPYLILLHEYTIYKNPSSVKRFNKVFKDLLCNYPISYEDSINLIDSLFQRENVGGELIKYLLSKLDKEIKDKRMYIKNLKLCKYICKKQGDNSGEAKYKKRIANEYIKLSEEKDGFIKNKFIKEAIKYDSSKEIYYQENRGNISLNSFTIKNKLSWDVFMPYCIDSFDFYKLIKIITNLTLHFKTETGDPLIDNCTINYIDENNNITEEKDNPALLNTQIEISYHAELIWHLLHYGHLYHQEISSYFNNSWFDKDILNNIEYPLKIIFKENKSDLEIKCAISILIPQFEKIIRKIAIKNRIINDDEEFSEKSKMSVLIKIDEFKKLLSEDIHNYINYVFFNFNLGLNLRNKFLHSTTNDIFTEKNLYILFICLIKLSNNFNNYVGDLNE